jgi:chemotaxis protein MotB
MRRARCGLMLAGLAMALAAGVGCNQQQLEERNAALQKQLEQALIQNGDLQGENDSLRGQNQNLLAEVDRLRTQPAAPAPVAAAPASRPDFGAGVDVSMVGDTMTLTIADNILFDSGKADLKSASKTVLDRIATKLRSDYAGSMVRVEGHTDNQPIVKTKNLWQDNWDLSCNRSMAVVRYLTTKGMDPKRIYAAGYSFNKPVATNATPAGRAKNRRVAIVVSKR